MSDSNFVPALDITAVRAHGKTSKLNDYADIVIQSFMEAVDAGIDRFITLSHGDNDILIGFHDKSVMLRVEGHLKCVFIHTSRVTERVSYTSAFTPFTTDEIDVPGTTATHRFLALSPKQGNALITEMRGRIQTACHTSSIEAGKAIMARGGKFRHLMTTSNQ